jgi:hypothetical protein
MRSPFVAVLAAGALAFALASDGSAQSYDGTWTITPLVHFPGFGAGCPTFLFNQLYITDENPSVTVSTNSGAPNNPGTMTGSFVTPTKIKATSTGTGPCGKFITYTLTLKLGSEPTFTGTFQTLSSGQSCFCGNPNFGFKGTLTYASIAYCTAGTSGIGCRPYIQTSGWSSTSEPSGFVVTAYDVEGAKSAMFFHGVSGRQANPWGNGTSFQCVAPPVKRSGLQTATGVPWACDGTLALDLNAQWCPTCPKPLHNPGPGSLVQLQLWYRDPLTTSNQPTSFSDAIEFTVWP